jgi:putative membrane protein
MAACAVLVQLLTAALSLSRAPTFPRVVLHASLGASRPDNPVPLDPYGELSRALHERRGDDLLAEVLYERPRGPSTVDLRTDDGIALDARDLRQRRSDWLRDLLSIGSSRILESLSERLVAILLWSLLVLGAVEIDGWGVGPVPCLHLREVLAIPAWPHEAGCGLLAILLVFRTDQAYDRFWEARQRWADVNSAVRSLATLALAHYPPGRARDLLLAHAATFPFALKQHMRGLRDLCRLEEAFLPYAAPRLGAERARELLVGMLDEDSVPAALLNSLTAEVGVLLRPRLPAGYRVRAADSQGQRQASLWSALQGRIDVLSDAMAACERLKLTPIPWAYARHTSRYCTLFLVSLPFALLSDEADGGSARPLVLKLVIVAAFAYTLYGLEEIGHLIEEPFSVAFPDELSVGRTGRVAAGAGREGEPVGAAPPAELQPSFLRACARAFLSAVGGLFGSLQLLLGVRESADETRRRTAELEVLPLRKYCYTSHHELANLAAQRSHRERLEAADEAAERRALGRLLVAARRALGRALGTEGGGSVSADDGASAPGLDSPERYRQIAAEAKVRLELIGDRRL